MDASAIIDTLTPLVPGASLEVGKSVDFATIYVPADHLPVTARLLLETPALRFNVLTELTAVDFMPREPRFEVVVHLVSLGVSGYGDTPKRLRLKVRVPGGDPRMPTLSGVWASMNWAEREVYDLFGIHFDGHPDLRRILMPEDYEGHPQRRDFPIGGEPVIFTYNESKMPRWYD